MIPINLAVEDELSEMVLRRLITESGREYCPGKCHRRGGFGYLKNRINAFNGAAKKGIPFIVLTDLDQAECAPSLIHKWLKQPPHPNLMFRVAVREVEAWLLASRVQFAKFLGISENAIPHPVDQLRDPKQTLLQLAKKSRKRRLREAIVPAENSTATIGPDYNGALGEFVRTTWDIAEARIHSESLRRTVLALQHFQPDWKA